MIQVFSFTHQSFTKLPFWGSWGQMGKEGRTHGTLNKSSVFSLCLLTQTSCHAAIACSRGLGRASERTGREAKVWSTPGDAPPLQTWAIRLAQWGLPCLQLFPSLFSFMAILKVIGFKIYWVLLHTLHIVNQVDGETLGPKPFTISEPFSWPMPWGFGTQQWCIKFCRQLNKTLIYFLKVRNMKETKESII